MDSSKRIDMNKTFLLLGSLNAFLSVALGAFGAHGLKSRLSEEMLQTYQTGVNYHMFHAFGLLIVGVVAQWLANSTLLNWAGWSMTLGILLFSGSLYLMSITGVRWLGAITPFGGIGFLAGWLLLAVAIFKK